MSYFENESQIKLTLSKQKIIESLLFSNYELLAITFARIYTANANSQNKDNNWMYSELEGGLTLVVDHRRKTARFLMFNLMTFEITFESELYKNFHVFYTNLTDTFQCFEVIGGFIGFSIPDKISSRTFSKTVSNLSDNVIAKRIKEFKNVNKTEIKSNSVRSLKLLKKKLDEEYFFKEKLIADKKIEFDAYQIEKLFDFIEYDKENENFVILGGNDEIQELLTKSSMVKMQDKGGLKVSDRKAYAMEIYKNLINTIRVEKDKEKVVGKINMKVVYKEVFGTENKTPIVNNKSNVSQIKPNNIVIPPVAKGNIPPVSKGNIPPVAKGKIPTPPKGIIPPVPKGIVPPVPKGIAPTLSNSIVNSTNKNNNIIKSDIQTDSKITTTIDSKEVTLIPTQKVKPPPKLDLQSELRMKLAMRQSKINTEGNVAQIPIMSIESNRINIEPQVNKIETILKVNKDAKNDNEIKSNLIVKQQNAIINNLIVKQQNEIINNISAKQENKKEEVIKNVPIVTNTPKVVNVPIVTNTPKVVNEPKVVNVPIVTNTPKVVNVPIVTNTPKVVNEPKVVNVPIVTNTPKVVNVPIVTNTPKVVNVPIVTNTPKVVNVPNAPKLPNAPNLPPKIPQNEETYVKPPPMKNSLLSEIAVGKKLKKVTTKISHPYLNNTSDTTNSSITPSKPNSTNQNTTPSKGGNLLDELKKRLENNKK